MNYIESDYSDFHKEAFGRRPTAEQWAKWDSMSEVQKQAEWETVERILKYDELARKTRNLKAINDVETKLSEFQRKNNIERSAAIQMLWNQQGYWIDFDITNLEFDLMLPIGYFAKTV